MELVLSFLALDIQGIKLRSLGLHSMRLYHLSQAILPALNYFDQQNISVGRDSIKFNK